MICSFHLKGFLAWYLFSELSKKLSDLSGFDNSSWIFSDCDECVSLYLSSASAGFLGLVLSTVVNVSWSLVHIQVGTGNDVHQGCSFIDAAL